ncbi:tyrosine-type recombinase/integrase [Gordonia sp. 852002-10350_SCH5691597]|uniref:tyrosine-type recombinase/integrase n=1 Tax=Gordonia sp. 852002-10350_SCH5691597 TaxID=1834085 RepID=UPI0007EAF25E|nr:site-specific integrase [Gordonia sp. 852002-10350_SCH5691597]OBA63662.1 hypothetical protein A5777_00175 [Gordonia sp. 852002-10350_SCH5691597]
MASLRPVELVDGTCNYRVLWRQDGKQRSLTFEDIKKADAFRCNVERFGPDDARKLLGLIDSGTSHTTLTQWCTSHIETLTGIEEATRDRYRAYVKNDIAPTIGAMPLEAVTDVTVARWVNDMDGAGKTIANKHGFLAGALNHAVRAGKIPKNPCEHTRLPRKDSDEMVFLTRDEFALLCGAMTERWQPLTMWLVGTGTRFGEATALTVGDIDPATKTARINKAWKYTGSNKARRLALPKTRKGVRTVDVPASVIELLDLDREPGELLFPTRDGGPISNQLYKNKAWLPALKKVSAVDASPRLLKKPRVHDLRHTYASWAINAGANLKVVQAQMGHESITVTADTYGHLDRASGQLAAEAIGRLLG